MSQGCEVLGDIWLAYFKKFLKVTDTLYALCELLEYLYPDRVG